MAATKTPEAPARQSFEDQVTAQLQNAKARLDQIGAKGNESLKKASADIERKVRDLKTASAVHASRAKAEIDADVKAFTASVDEMAANVKSRSNKK